MKKVYDVVIIGAGMSGLSAAYEAKQKGLSYVVLEAKDRVGGRVCSKKLKNGLVVELGGEWIGKTHKELLAFCRKFSIKLEPHRYQNLRYTFKDGQEFKEVLILLKKLEEIVAKFSESSVSNKTDWYSRLEKKFTEEELRIISRIYAPDFATHMRYVAAYDAYFEMKKGGETDHLDYHVKGGNSKITEKLWCEVGKRNVRLGEEVTTIVDKDGVVSVGTAKKTYVAKKVLMTASVKTFKNIEISPALKEKKTVARNLTYGDITKAFVSFSGCVPFKKQDFSMVYENDIQYIYLASQGQSENRFALCIYAVGPAAKKIYKMKSEVLTKKVKALLPADVFDVNSLVLSEVVVQNWGSEIFTGGGYCIFNPSEHKEVRRALGAPHGKNHFAGDYLGISFNYMNGAFQSGRDEMRRIKTGL